jgi:hypothetical protein
MQRTKRASGEGALAINRATEAVDNPTHEGLAHIDSSGAASGGDIAPGMNFLHLAKRHQKNPVIAESHNLGLQARKSG